MSQTLHLLKKDLRILRLPLLLLYLLLLAQTVFALRDPIFVDRVFLQIDVVFPLLNLLAMVVTVGLLVHQEPVVGTTAFWLTRPIHRGSLLKAKALFLMVFVVVPIVVASLGVAFTFGLGIADLGAPLESCLMPLSALLIVAVLLAALTPNIAIYLMTWIGLLFTSHLISALVGLFIDGDRYVVSSASKDLVETAALVIFGGLLVAHQYFTRRTRRTIIGAGVALFAGVAITDAWRWEIVEWSNPLFEMSPVSLTLSSSEQGGVFSARRRSDDQLSALALASFAGHPSLDFEVRAVEGELQFGDRPPVRVTAGQLFTRTPDTITGLERFRWLDGWRPGPPLVELTTQGAATFDELIAKSGTLQADVRGQAYRYELAGKVPLKVGARIEKGDLVAVITEISQGDEQLRIVLRYRQIQSTNQDAKYPRVLLINDARKEMLPAGNSGYRHFQPFGVFVWGPQVVSREETYDIPPRSHGGGPPAPGSDWLADAELAIIEWAPEGGFKTTLRLADFRLREATSDRKTHSSSVAN